MRKMTTFSVKVCTCTAGTRGAEAAAPTGQDVPSENVFIYTLYFIYTLCRLSKPGFYNCCENTGPRSLRLPAASQPRPARLLWGSTPRQFSHLSATPVPPFRGRGTRRGAVPLSTPLPSGARPRRAGKMAAAGRAWRAAALLPAWRLRAPGRAYGAAAGGGGSGGGRLLLGAAFALGGGAGLYLAARHRLWEHSAAEVTRCRAPLAASRPVPRGSSRRHPRVGHRARSLPAPRALARPGQGRQEPQGGCGRFLLALGTKRVVLLPKPCRGGPGSALRAELWGMSVSESSLG